MWLYAQPPSPTSHVPRLWPIGCASLTDDIVREGARRMLAAASQAEVAAYVAAHMGEVDEQVTDWCMKRSRQTASGVDFGRAFMV